MTPALPGFYCKNKGHRPLYVPFSRVNDGVCDYEFCCDGSDEWEHVGGVKCADKCKEIGKQWRKEEEARTKALAAAMKVKKSLLQDAARMRGDVEREMQALKQNIGAAEQEVKVLEKKLEEEIRKDSGRVVKGASASGKGGKLATLVGLAKQRTEELLGALSDVRRQRDEAKAKIASLESLLSTFHEEYNPNFNDEGVKRAVRAWEDYVANGKSGPTAGDDALERDIEEISKPDSDENGINWAQWEATEDEGLTDHDADISKYRPTSKCETILTDPVYNKVTVWLPPFLREIVDSKITSARQWLIENGVLIDTSSTVTDPSASESKTVTESRNNLSSKQKDLENAQNDLRNKEEDLSKDYGEDDIWRALKDQCISKESGGYTYEVCFMGQAKQKPKRGGDTRMGNFVGFDTTTVDAVQGTPGIDPKSGTIEALSLKYEKGQKCWNGPERSTKVVLRCGDENRLLKIREEEKCVYVVDAESPAACGFGEKKKSTNGERARDEL